MAAEPGHGGVPEFYKNYYPGYNGATRTPMHTTEEKSSRRLVGSFEHFLKPLFLSLLLYFIYDSFCLTPIRSTAKYLCFLEDVYHANTKQNWKTRRL